MAGKHTKSRLAAPCNTAANNFTKMRAIVSSAIRYLLAVIEGSPLLRAFASGALGFCFMAAAKWPGPV
jgi:hypothetical protein